MYWLLTVFILLFIVAAGLLIGGFLYFRALSNWVPVRPDPVECPPPNECALEKIEKQALLNKQIQKKNDDALPDDAPLPDLTLSEEEKAKAKKQLDKLLQPEYAIALGYFAQKTYDDLKAKWNSYSDTALGLIFALALLAFSLIMATYISRILAYGIGAALFLVTALLFIIALGARDMFFAEVHNDLLAAIEIKYDASYHAMKAAADATIKAAKEKKKNKPAENDLQKAIQAELKKATFTVKGLVVNLTTPEDEAR